MSHIYNWPFKLAKRLDLSDRVFILGAAYTVWEVKKTSDEDMIEVILENRPPMTINALTEMVELQEHIYTLPAYWQGVRFPDARAMFPMG